MGQSSLLLNFAVVGVSLVLAVLTYLLVERPIKKNRRRLPKGWQPVAVACGVSTVLLFAGHFYQQTPADVKSARAQLLKDLWPDLERLETKRELDPCFARLDGSIDAACRANAVHMGLLIGDSHAGKWYEGIRGPAAKADVRLISLVQNGCDPSLIENSHRCLSRFDRSLREASTFGLKPDFAILGAAWNRFFFGRGWRADKTISRSDHDRFVKRLTDSIALLEERGIKRFLLIGPVPEFAVEAPICLQRAIFTGRTSEICSVQRRVVDQRRKFAVGGLRRVAQANANVRFIDPIEVFCDSRRCQPRNASGVSYTDDNHLSTHGSRSVYRYYAKTFEWAMGVAEVEAKGARLVRP